MHGTQTVVRRVRPRPSSAACLGAHLVACWRAYTSIPTNLLGRAHCVAAARDAGHAVVTPGVVRVPRLLFFGGDVVSVVALEALHTRLSCIVRHALTLQGTRCTATASRPVVVPDAGRAALNRRVEQIVRDHLTVVCPSLPPQTSLRQVARRYSRQYPVARFCAERGLPAIPVDHNKSLVKSRLLEEMLSPSVAARRHSSVAVGEDATWAAQGRPLACFDLAIIVSFRYFIPRRLLQALPPTINMHPSLLPRYRGASPIFSTLMRNETCGGVSIIQVTPEQTLMDAGNVLWQCEVPISPDMDIRLYFPLVTQIGAAGLCDLVFGEADRHARDDSPKWARSSSDGGDRGTQQEWRTLFRLPPRLTTAVVADAAQVHRGHLLLQLRQQTEATSKARPLHNVSPTNVSVARQCADVFPASVLNPHCDWPDSFTYSWRFAVAQQYESFHHFSADPYHAPLLPKDAAVLYFARYTALQAFGVWRAFVGGQYFHPAMQCILDRTRTPVYEQLLGRIVRRLARAQAGRGVEKQESSIATASAATVAPDKTSVAYQQLVRAAEAELRLGCSFTQAVHPTLVAPAVMHELSLLEECDTARVASLRVADPMPATPLQPIATTTRITIAPGTGYFPRADEELGAIRCREGWFVWRAAHLKSAARAQPVSLLRKGLAMRTGTLYPCLFTN